MEIKGIGVDAPTIVHANGAKESATPYALDLADPWAMLALGGILAEGEIKYGKDNWHGISVQSNVRHALTHIYAFLAGDTSDDHLGHAHCRMMMAHANHLRAGRADAKRNANARPRRSNRRRLGR